MPERILIVRMSSPGDIIQATPVARGLKRALPDCHVTWFIRERAAAVLQGNPHVDAMIVCPDHLRVNDCVALWWQLKAGRFTTTIDLEGMLKSAGVTYTSDAARRIGRERSHLVVRLAYTELSPTRDDHDYISQSYLRQCESLGVDVGDYVPELFLSDEELRAAERMYAEHGLDRSRPVVGLVVFSTMSKREWLPEYCVELGNMLSQEMGARIFIPGSRKERPRAEAIAARMRGDPVVFAGMTSFREAVALLARADLVVGVDSGLTHAAYAVGTPVVSLIGSTPRSNGPAGERTRTILPGELACRPCRLHAPCADVRCMRLITPQMVAEAALELAAATGVG